MTVFLIWNVKTEPLLNEGTEHATSLSTLMRLVMDDAQPRSGFQPDQS